MEELAIPSNDGGSNRGLNLNTLRMPICLYSIHLCLYLFGISGAAFGSGSLNSSKMDDFANFAVFK